MQQPLKTKKLYSANCTYTWELYEDCKVSRSIVNDTTGSSFSTWDEYTSLEDASDDAEFQYYLVRDALRIEGIKSSSIEAEVK